MRLSNASSKGLARNRAVRDGWGGAVRGKVPRLPDHVDATVEVALVAAACHYGLDLGAHLANSHLAGLALDLVCRIEQEIQY